MQNFHVVTPTLASWGPWELFKECSVTCGKGVAVHIRECINLESIPIGNLGCAGKITKVKPCDKGCCKGTNLHVTILL